MASMPCTRPNVQEVPYEDGCVGKHNAEASAGFQFVNAQRSRAFVENVDVVPREEAPDRRRPSLHKDRPQRSLQRVDVDGVDAQSPASVDQREPEAVLTGNGEDLINPLRVPKTCRITVNHYTSLYIERNQVELRLGTSM
jgi:hypothetical protein